MIIYIVIFILIIFWWYFSIIYCPTLVSISNHHHFELKDKLLTQSKNGDLVFFSGNTFGESSIKYYTKSIVSHVALIFWDTDIFSNNLIPYIWESDLGQDYKDGPRIMRLIDKLDRYKGDKICIWKRYFGPPITTSAILSIVPKYVDMDINVNMIYWLYSSKPESATFKFFKPSDCIYCSELIASTFIDIGIFDTSHHPSYYTPQYFLDLSKYVNNNNGLEIYYGICRFIKF